MNSYISSSTKRILLFRASMALISSSLSEKSNICKKRTTYCYIKSLKICFHIYFEKSTWKLCLILSILKLFGITTTPLWTLKRRATWALLLLYFFPMDISSSSSSRGGHVTFTLNQTEKKTQMQQVFYANSQMLKVGKNEWHLTFCCITYSIQHHWADSLKLPNNDLLWQILT